MSMVLEHCEYCHNRFENYKKEPCGGYVCRKCRDSRPKIWTNMAGGFVDYDASFMKYRMHQRTRSGILTDNPSMLVDKNGRIMATYNKKGRGRKAKYNSEIIAYIAKDGRRIIELVYYNTAEGAKRFKELAGMTHAEFLKWRTV